MGSIRDGNAPGRARPVPCSCDKKTLRPGITVAYYDDRLRQPIILCNRKLSIARIRWRSGKSIFRATPASGRRMDSLQSRNRPRIGTMNPAAIVEQASSLPWSLEAGFQPAGGAQARCLRHYAVHGELPVPFGPAHGP